MGYFMMHLKVAEGLLACNKQIQDAAAFYEGSLAPDTIMFMSGRRRSDKEITHFCVGDEGWGCFTNYEEWEDNLNRRIQAYVGKINHDFLLGYYSHVYTDILNTRQFVTPSRLINEKNDDDSHMEKFIKDCYEIDTRLMESLENKKNVWKLLKKAKNYTLPGISDHDDIHILLNAMKKKMYRFRYSHKHYEFSVLTYTDMLDFIGTTVAVLSEKCAELQRIV